MILALRRSTNGGIAQLARAFGSYPECPRFKSRCRYDARDVRKGIPFHPNQGPLVKWLRHRPFTAVTWVRVPYGSPLWRLSSAQQQLFGTGRLTEALNANPAASCVELVENVKSAVDAFVQEAPQFDDTTMLAMRYYGPGTN